MLSTGEGPGLDHQLEDAGLDGQCAIMFILLAHLSLQGQMLSWRGRGADDSGNQ